MNQDEDGRANAVAARPDRPGGEAMQRWLMKRQWWWAVVWFAVCGSVLGGPPATAAERSKDDVVVAFGLLGPSLDPQIQFAVPIYALVRHIFDPLVEFDAQNTIGPKLAESWRLAEPTAWEFKLRKGVKFHNGEPFTANSVKFTLERVVKPETKSPQAFIFAWLDRVDVPDPYTAVIRTKGPYRPILSILAVTEMLDAKAAADPAAHGLKPVGTGAFKFVEFLPNSRVVLVRNEDYWGPKPKFKNLTFREIRDNSTRVASLETGETDVIHNPPPEDIPRLNANPKLEVKSIPSSRAMGVYLNTRKTKPLQDIRVRQALNHAVDKEALIRFILKGMTTPLKGPMTEEVSFFNPNLKPYAYNPELAKKLLAEAGYPNGFSIAFGHPTGRWVLDKEIPEAVAAQLAKVGIKATLTTLEWGTYIADYTAWRRGEGKFDVLLGGWGTITYDADWALWNNFHTPNPFGLANAEVDKLLEQGRGAFDLKEADAVYRKAQEQIWTEAPWIWLFKHPEITGVNKRLKNFAPRVNEYIMVRDAWVE